MPVPPDYRIIYNWDGAPHGYSPAPQSMQDFLEKVYAPLEETQVGALFWSTGGQGSRWPSDVVEFIGEARERPYPSAGAYNATENILRMYDRGEDPQEALIERGRELGLHVYASVRMNDNHLGGAQVADLEALRKAHRVEALRHEHPEWVLGERTSEWFALSWNMAVPEIRERRFHHVEEICRRYDWDGVELDWQRHAFHFPDGHGYRLRYLLTDLQRAVRRMTEALGRERGRPVFLAARVAGSLEMCRRIGYDVPTWVEEGLVDVLIPAGNAVTDAGLDVAEFVELCDGTDIAVYPGFDSNLPDPFVGPEEPEEKDRLRTRAIASRYHRAGASGIYVFNWHANRDSKRPLLTTIGAPGEPGRHRQDLRRHPSLHTAGGGLARRLPHRPDLRPGAGRPRADAHRRGPHHHARDRRGLRDLRAGLAAVAAARDGVDGQGRRAGMVGRYRAGGAAHRLLPARQSHAPRRRLSAAAALAGDSRRQHRRVAPLGLQREGSDGGRAHGSSRGAGA